MLTRAQVILLAGLLLLAAGTALTYIAARAHRGQPLVPFSRRRLHPPRGTLRLMRRCLFLRADAPELEALHTLSRPLTEALLMLRRTVSSLPPLPGEREPRIMAVARQAASGGEITPAMLQRLLGEWDAEGVTAAERLALPACVSAALSERLCVTLRTLLQDERDRQHAVRLAAQLCRSKRPMLLLTSRQLSLTELATLLTLLRAQRQTMLLELIGEWLSGHGADAEDIADRHARRQAAIADDLHAAARRLAALRLMDWPAAAEACDPLHELLLTDPSGLYPRMTKPARQHLRTRAERLASWLHVGGEALVRAALKRCSEAEPLSLERQVGYYLLEYTGMSALRTELALRRGRIRTFAATHPCFVRRSTLWGTSMIGAILFLNDGNPLFMLPAFLVVIGSLPRAVISRVTRRDALPAMEITAVTDDLRTLVVLPATLSDPSDVLRMLRYLRTARSAFPAHGVDCFLLGDYAAAMTQRSSADAAIIAAAVQGTSALCDASGSGRFMYMQRARRWIADRHTYGPRGGHEGALESICRLIAQGECEDYLDHATLSPAALHRRYAYVLLLDGVSRPAPGMLEALLSAAAHPLNMRYPLPDGMRGSSCFAPTVRGMYPSSGTRGIRLIRPDAYLEATDGLLDREAAADGGFLADALSGTTVVSEAHALRDGEPGMLRQAGAACRRAYRLCRLLPWLLPWVKTPSGVVRNPLSANDRFELRERLRTAFMPVMRCVLLLWALLERNAPLLLIALLLPGAADAALHGRRRLWEAVQRTALLPLHASASVYAAYRACLPLIRRQESPTLREPENWSGLQLWTQCTAAIICFLLGVVLPPLWLPALVPAAVFVMYPLLHQRETRQLAPAQVLPAAGEPALRNMAEATWRYFRDAVDASPCALPPAWTQSDPPVSLPARTTPESAGMYLMAVVSARELGFISTQEAGERIAAALGVLTALPLRHGLPCAQYSLPSLEAADDTIDVRGCGVLLTALMTAAQALRTWLPELPAHQHALPASLDALADALAPARLFDPSAQLFHLSLDRDGIGTGHVLYFTDTSLLLSVSACARGLVPPAHFASLSRTCTEAGGDRLPLSSDGDLAACLLPSLFLPLDSGTAERFVWLHQKHGSKGLWGRSASAEYAFTPELHYRRSRFGLREVASDDPVSRPVFAPYAVALALTCTPSAALRCLQEMQQLGGFGPHGFADAIDMSRGEPQVVQIHDAFHQGLILCAAAHVLGDAPLQRYFCGIPAVEACLPLLAPQDTQPVLLPPRPLFNPKTPSRTLPERTADPAVTPVDAHLIGSRDACFTMNAMGSCRMLSQDVPLTRFTGDPLCIEGMQLYLIHRGRVFRLTDPSVPGETVYASGVIRTERLCGCLRTQLTITTDPAGGRFLHLVEVANLSTADCRFEVASVLNADLNAKPETLEAERPAPQHLQLRSRADGRTLHHHVSLSCPPLQMAVCTDLSAFLGRSRTLVAPASLEEPMADLYARSCADCLSFRAQLTLSGRATARLLFTTGLTMQPPPQWQEVNGLLSVAGLHARAVADAIPIAPDTLAAASRMTGALLWHGQPHQGARIPLEASLAEPLLHAQPPLLTVTVPDEAAVSRLRESLQAAAWFMLHGQPITVYVLCTAQTTIIAEEAVRACLLAESSDAVRILTDASPMLQEALTAVSGLVIYGDGRALSSQMNALAKPLSLHAPHPLPAQGHLPDMELTNPGGYGGFDPVEGDYIIRLEAHQTTPVPWLFTVTGDAFAFTADETGLHSPFGERLMLSLDGGTPFDPLRAGLPMTVRVGLGSVRWQIHAADFTLTLDAAPLAGHCAGLRAVRLRNHRKEALSAVLTVTASLSPSPVQHLTAAPDAVFVHGGAPGFLAAAEGDWTADIPDTIVLRERHRGSRAARLSLPIVVPAGHSGSGAWLCGNSSAADDAVSAQETFRKSGVSACLRDAAKMTAALLPGLSISTPEPTLDLLVNHVLPRQVLSAGLPLTCTALTSPGEARDRLLTAVQNCPADSLRPSLLTALYLHLTGDSTVLGLPIGDADSLLTRCREAIIAHRLERSSTVPSRQQLCEAFLAAAAAAGILAYADDDALRDHRRSLLSIADAFLWQTDHYGAPDTLLLDVQACAALASASAGSTVRTRKSLRACWDALYDREHGLIRQQLPTEAPECPGTIHNGGQETMPAVLYLATLAAVGDADRAWELLRALNPLHHTDDPVRSETFAGAPWLLPAGIQAAPAHAGHAVGYDAAAADLLLTIILTQLLGLTRRDGCIVMSPRVPTDWDCFSITLHIGASTWRIEMDRSIEAPLRDGIESPPDGLRLHDDGRIHQLRLPLK